MHKYAKFLAAAVILPLILASCKINTINYFPPHPANVRVANLLPDAAALNVTVAGQPAWSGLAFQTLTGYQSFDNETTLFQVSQPGATSPLVQISYSLAGEQSYTLVTYGSVNFPSTLMMVDTPASGGNGNFALVVANVAIGIGTIDVYITSPGTVIANVTPTFTGVAYGALGVIGNFSPGNYQIRVTLTGNKSPIYDSGSLAFGGNTVFDMLVYSKGSAHLVNVALLDINAGAQNAIANNLLSEVKVVNAAPQTGAINMLLGSTAVASNLAYATSTVYQTVPAGAQTFTFEAVSTPGATIATLATTMGAANDQSVFLYGLPGALTAVPLTDLNVPPRSGNVRLRFVNAATGGAPFDVLVNGTKLVSALASPTASQYVEVVAGTTNMSFVDSATGAVLLTLANVVLTGSQTSTVYVVGTPTALTGVVSQDI